MPLFELKASAIFAQQLKMIQSRSDCLTGLREW